MKVCFTRPHNDGIIFHFFYLTRIMKKIMKLHQRHLHKMAIKIPQHDEFQATHLLNILNSFFLVLFFLQLNKNFTSISHNNRRN